MKEKDDGKTIVILVRHGECQGNRDGLFRGRSDFPLNEAGLLQAKELAIELKSFQPDKIFTSPLSRAEQTAEEIARECGTQVETRESLNNIQLGPWEGKPKKYIAEKYPDAWQTWIDQPENLLFEEMESLDQVQKRAREDLDDIIQQCSGKTVVVVSHRAILKPLIASCLGIRKPYFWRIHLDTASYSLLYFEKRRGYTLVQLNQNKHLSEYIAEWQ